VCAAAHPPISRDTRLDSPVRGGIKVNVVSQRMKGIRQ
jgi:hypothetical protein